MAEHKMGRLKRELSIWQRLKHASVIQLLQVVEAEATLAIAYATHTREPAPSRQHSVTRTRTECLQHNSPSAHTLVCLRDHSALSLSPLALCR